MSLATIDWSAFPGYQQLLDVADRIGMDHAQWGYTLFDAGSYGYQSVTSHTLAPILYARRAAAQQPLPEAGSSAPASTMDLFSGSDVTANWVFMISVSTIIAGFLCPILGTIADLYAYRKLFTYAASLLSIAFLTIFAWCSVQTSVAWLLFYAGTAMVFSSLSQAFYSSLIMTVTESHQIVKVACIQCCFGSFGAALLMTALGIHSTSDTIDQSFFLFCFVIAAIWFFLLAIPMWLWVQEDPPRKDTTWQEICNESYHDLTRSFDNVELIKYTVSCLLTNDALATIVAVYLVYGMQIGIPVHYLLMGAVYKRWVSVAAALAWFGASTYVSARMCLMLSAVFGLVAIVLCAWMSNAVDFFVMCTFLTIGQAGCYIYQKVLMSEMTFKEKASHHFGFMSMASRVAGFLGPFLFTVVSLCISDRAAFMALLFMLLAGLIMLSMVDFDKGYKHAVDSHAKDKHDDGVAAAAVACGQTIPGTSF